MFPCLWRSITSLTRDAPPAYLAPALAPLLNQLSLQQPPCQQKFSTSPSHFLRRYRRDNNKLRGVSALRRKGFKKPISIRPIVARLGLPKPVLDPKRRSKIHVDDNHGLWGFFNEKKELLSTPDEEAKHGEYSHYDIPTQCPASTSIWRNWANLGYRAAMVSSRAETQELGGSSCTLVDVLQRAKSDRDRSG